MIFTSRTQQLSRDVYVCIQRTPTIGLFGNRPSNFYMNLKWNLCTIAMKLNIKEEIGDGVKLMANSKVTETKTNYWKTKGRFPST